MNTPFTDVSNSLRGDFVKDDVLFGFSPDVIFSELVASPDKDATPGVNYVDEKGKTVNANGGDKVETEGDESA